MNSRQIAIVAAVVFAIASPALQATGDVGLSAAEFSRAGDGTLRAAGYAFSIWSVIYAGLMAFAVYQALPAHRDDPLVEAVAKPAVAAITGTGLWIWASALDARWLTVVIIVASAAALTLGLIGAARTVGRPDLKARAFVWWPLSLMAGWLTIASAINILTVLTAEGLLAGATQAAAFAGVVAVLIVALLVERTPRLTVHAIPIAWGLVAVWVAEKASKSDVASLALGSAGVIAAYGLWQSRPRVSNARR